MSSSTRPRSQRICNHFNKSRGCFRGARCKYLHIRAGETSRRAEDSQPNELAQSEWITRDLEKVPPSVATTVKPRQVNVTTKIQGANVVNPAHPQVRRVQFNPRKPSKRDESRHNDTRAIQMAHRHPNDCSSTLASSSHTTAVTDQLRHQCHTKVNRISPNLELVSIEPVAHAASETCLQPSPRGIKRGRDGSPVPQFTDPGGMSLRYPQSSPPIACIFQKSPPSSPSPRQRSLSSGSRTHSNRDRRASPNPRPYSPDQYRSLDVSRVESPPIRHVKLEPLDKGAVNSEDFTLTSEVKEEMELIHGYRFLTSNMVKRDSTQPKLEKIDPTETLPRVLQTTGTRYYGTVPPEFSQSKTARKSWAYSEARRLEEEFGLQIDQLVMRDDGLAINWSSVQPVWSDTLLPEAKSSPPKFNIAVVRPQPRPITPLDAERFLTRFFQSLNNDPITIPSAYSQTATFSVQLQRLDQDCLSSRNSTSLWHGFTFRNLNGSEAMSQAAPSLTSLSDYLDLHSRILSTSGHSEVQVDIILLSEDMLLLVGNQTLPKSPMGSQTTTICVGHTIILERHPAFDGPWTLQIKSHQVTIRRFNT